MKFEIDFEKLNWILIEFQFTWELFLEIIDHLSACIAVCLIVCHSNSLAVLSNSPIVLLNSLAVLFNNLVVKILTV